MKRIRFSVLLIAVLQILSGVSSARSLHPTRRDLVLAKRASAQSSSNRATRRPVRRNTSQPLPQSFARNASFVVAPQISAGGSPHQLASGDFNGDGLKDIAAIVYEVPNSTTYLSVLLGRGDATFNAPILTAANSDKKTLLFSADLNNDRKDDILLVRSGAVDVFLSAGAGSFQNVVTYQEGILDPAAVAITDVNHDGKLDLVIADGLNETLNRFFGNGDGTFQPPLVSTISAQFSGAILTDINNDGNLDLVTSRAVLIGNSSASFSVIIPLVGESDGSCTFPQDSVAVADMNNDGHPDILVADCADDVDIFLADGNGGFQPAIDVWAGFGPQAVHIADMNSDGIPDIVASNFYPGDVSILIGDGTGNFQSPKIGYAFGGTMLEPSVIDDFNGDGHPDVISAAWAYGASLSFLKGVGDGTLVAAEDYYPPQSMGDFKNYGTSVATTDFNHDGRPDVVLGGIFGPGEGGNLGGENAGITIFLGTQTGQLQQGTNYGTGGALASVAVADFNLDGNQDIVAADFNTGDVNLFLGNGDGTFQDPQIFSSAPAGANAIVVGDFNNDGYPDLAVTGWPSAAYLLLNNKHGQFQPALSYTLNDNAWAIAAGDVNNDGNLDLIIPHYVANTFSVLLGNGDGTFQALPDFDNGTTNPGGILLRDLNADGNLDLAFTTIQGAAVAFGNGDGTFRTPTLYDMSHGSDLSSTGNLLFADLNEDGRLDIAFTNEGFGTVDILNGNGDGTFAAATEVPVGGMPFDLLSTDLNSDGSPDIAVANLNYPGVTLLMNAGGATITLTASPNPATYGQPVVLSGSVHAYGAFTPTGIVTFMDGDLILGSSPVDSNGNASLAVPALEVGTHSVTAIYSGDSHLSPAASNPITELVQGGTPSYALAADPTSMELQPGQSAVFNITATSLNGFAGTVDFSCGQLPQGLSCNFAPSALVLSSGGSGSVELTVSATSNFLASADDVSHTTLAPVWAMFTFGIAGFTFIDWGRIRAASLRASALVLVFLALTGCGGNPTPVPAAAQSRTTSIQVQARAQKVSQTFDIFIVVHK